MILHIGFALFGIDNERHEIPGINIHQVPVDIAEQVRLFAHKDWLFTCQHAIPDHGGGYPSLADTGLVPDDHSLPPLFDVIDSHCHGIDLFGGQGVAQLTGSIIELLADIRCQLSYFILHLTDGKVCFGIHHVRHHRVQYRTALAGRDIGSSQTGQFSHPAADHTQDAIRRKGDNPVVVIASLINDQPLVGIVIQGFGDLHPKRIFPDPVDPGEDQLYWLFLFHGAI